jgi:hypothetical protein
MYKLTWNQMVNKALLLKFPENIALAPFVLFGDDVDEEEL